MEKLKLVLSNLKYKTEYLEMIKECGEDIKSRGFDAVIPVSTEDTIEADIEKLTKMSEGIGLPDNWVPGSTYWLMDDERIIGVINIRHRLNEYLRFRGGHIAYYVRPTERNKGYGSKMLALALEVCRDLGIGRVLLTCLKENEYSAKIIQRNGGVLDSEDTDGGQVFQRYWIDIGEKRA